MTRMLAAAGFVFALAGFAQAGSAQTAAAETVTARQPGVAVPAAARADLPVHRGKFWFHSDCVTAGQQGVDRGHWSQYQCAEGWMWNLWTDR
ncbi:hypothetical protein Nocox_13080 [Nonomuraea coxensis DSM 45129]|uniref:Chitin-binding type-3 domain-containing protein n=1 Tax=Nonomuraea coxensis DSM 45129 TaxID=1122611 RepID=A0ABX8TY10_9ACTN|nr:hypothetical protein [Nonomuraea coxensis]QYC40234.1 hypothetical protein Nocox_13080 [Nonomuraea coxensis DSM 45129]